MTDITRQEKSAGGSGASTGDGRQTAAGSLFSESILPRLAANNNSQRYKIDNDSTRPSADEVAFALDLHRPAGDRSLPARIQASEKQVDYLQSLRLRIGLERWNSAKMLLLIGTSGTHNLTKSEADKLIRVIKIATEAGR